MLHKPPLFGLVAGILSFSSFAADQASMLFEQNAPMVFQVKVIDRASGNKSTIGSGFQVSPTGLLATNYHVVSDYVLELDKYNIEVLDHDQNSLEASLVNFDIVHDLALLQVAGAGDQSLVLSRAELSQGTRIYSMGNPNDLGMTIVEGTHNGLVEGSRYQKYLFSGSLNPGMSGGPVFNSDGEVIGVNVAKGGEQISFLVPVSHLVELIKNAVEPTGPDEYKSHATDSLIEDQDRYYGMLVGMAWQTNSFQQYDLPDRIHDSLKCWGHTLEKNDNLYNETHRHCQTTDEIYINSDFYTGSFSFNYESIESDELSRHQFFKLLEQNNTMSTFSNGNSKEDTTNFSCTTDFVALSNKAEADGDSWKVTTCAREYVEYEGLYDAGLIAINADSEDGEHQALIISMYTKGIDKTNIKKVHRKFLGAVK